MTRLDRHVNAVRTKLFLGTLLSALGWTLLVFAGAVLVGVAADRLLLARLPRWETWFFVGLGTALAGAVAWAIHRRPSPRQAAVFIDDRLGLDEKFSTALFVRTQNDPLNPAADPFAVAAIRDAERTADNVSLHKRFPVVVPRQGWVAAVVAVAAGLAFLVGPMPILGVDKPDAPPPVTKPDPAKVAAAKQVMKDAISAIDAAPQAAAADPDIQAARAELQRQLSAPTRPPEQQVQTALKSMQQLESLKQKIADQKAVAGVTNSKLQEAANVELDKGSDVAGLREALAKGDAVDAGKEAKALAEKFAKMNAEEQRKAAEDMKKLADSIKKSADQTQQQQQQAQKDLQQQLQNMGATQQQAQQLSQLAQQAAAGNPQAQQQLQQAAQQLSQQLNNNPNLTPQQQQSIQQQVQSAANQMQGAAAQQQQAQNLSGAAQQLAQAMGQQAAQASGQQPQQGNAGNPQQGNSGNPQQANGGNPKQGNSGNPQQANGGNPQPGGGNQPGGANPQANAGSPQPGGGSGQQPNGGGNQPGGSQGVQGAAQNFSQQLSQMQQPGGAGGPTAGGQSQQAQGGAQPGDGIGQDDGTFPGSGQAGQPGDQGDGSSGQAGGGMAGGDKPGGSGQGQYQQGDPNGRPGGGSGGPGQGMGKGPKPVEAAHTVKPELSPSKTIKDGPLLASHLIKSDPVKGDRRAEARAAVNTQQVDATQGEVVNDKITRQKASIVKRYFDDVGKDGK